MVATLCIGGSPKQQIVRLGRIHRPTNGRELSDSISADFGKITSIRELSDGRALVTDALDNKLLLVDFRADRVSSIGRSGRGPGEYVRVGRLLALRADSTILLDQEHEARWLVLVGDRIAATVAPDNAAMLSAGPEIDGADVRGRVLGRRAVRPTVLASGERRARRMLVLVERVTGKGDSIAVVDGELLVERSLKIGTDRQRVTYQVIGASPEQGVLFPDGWIAIVRMNPYRVDWRTPDGGVRAGARLSAEDVAINEAEKKTWRQRLIEREGEAAAGRLLDPPFASSWAPITDDALLPTPEGSLLIRRMPVARSTGTEYDVVDRRGKIQARLQLKWSERVVGYGARWLYVAERDENGTEHLHRWHRK